MGPITPYVSVQNAISPVIFLARPTKQGARSFYSLACHYLQVVTRLRIDFIDPPELDLDSKFRHKSLDGHMLGEAFLRRYEDERATMDPDHTIPDNPRYLTTV